MRKTLILIILSVVFFTTAENIVFADDSTGAAAWTVQLFAGPGKGEAAVNTITSSDGITGGPNKIYAVGSRFVPPDGRERVLYEFIWTGDSWNRIITQLPSGDFFNVPKELGFYDLRRDGKKRLYFSTQYGEIYEYSCDGQVWTMDSYMPNSNMVYGNPNGFVIGNRGANDNLKLYRSSAEHQLEEYYWNGITWEMINAQDIYIRPEIAWKQINCMAFGHVRDNDKNYLYILGMTCETCPIIEFEWYATTWQETLEDGSVTWKGPGWKENSRVGGLSTGVTYGRPQLFAADAGSGLKLYIAVDNCGGIYECEWSSSQNRWRTRKISLDGNIAGITYGKISWEDTDPVAIYALVMGNGSDSTINSADEIHEYTFDKNANRGRGAWARTYKVKLWADNMQEIPQDILNRGTAYSDFCMTNGRNEIIIDADGRRIDKYQRLYIADTLGNVWECSIPPRRLRPDYRPEIVPSKKPTITGD